MAPRKKKKAAHTVNIDAVPLRRSERLKRNKSPDKPSQTAQRAHRSPRLSNTPHLKVSGTGGGASTTSSKVTSSSCGKKNNFKPVGLRRSSRIASPSPHPSVVAPKLPRSPSGVPSSAKTTMCHSRRGKDQRIGYATGLRRSSRLASPSPHVSVAPDKVTLSPSGAPSSARTPATPSHGTLSLATASTTCIPQAKSSPPSAKNVSRKVTVIGSKDNGKAVAPDKVTLSPSDAPSSGRTPATPSHGTLSLATASTTCIPQAKSSPPSAKNVSQKVTVIGSKDNGRAVAPDNVTLSPSEDSVSGRRENVKVLGSGTDQLLTKKSSTAQTSFTPTDLRIAGRSDKVGRTPPPPPQKQVIFPVSARPRPGSPAALAERRSTSLSPEKVPPTKRRRSPTPSASGRGRNPGNYTFKRNPAELQTSPNPSTRNTAFGSRGNSSPSGMSDRRSRLASPIPSAAARTTSLASTLNTPNPRPYVKRASTPAPQTRNTIRPRSLAPSSPRPVSPAPTSTRPKPVRSAPPSPASQVNLLDTIMGELTGLHGVVDSHPSMSKKLEFSNHSAQPDVRQKEEMRKILEDEARAEKAAQDAMRRRPEIARKLSKNGFMVWGQSVESYIKNGAIFRPSPPPPPPPRASMIAAEPPVAPHPRTSYVDPANGLIAPTSPAPPGSADASISL